MKNFLSRTYPAYLLAVLFTFVAFTVIAQPPPPPPPPPPPGPPAPIDGGLALLIGAGLTYGAKKLYNK